MMNNPTVKFLHRRIPTFWLWFATAWGLIGIMPFWPHKDGSLLPLATPYFNGGFQTRDAIILAIHSFIACVIAFAIAGTIHFVGSLFRQCSDAN